MIRILNMCTSLEIGATACCTIIGIKRLIAGLDCISISVVKFMRACAHLDKTIEFFEFFKTSIKASTPPMFRIIFFLLGNKAHRAKPRAPYTLSNGFLSGCNKYK